jgi:hypothetical protein
MLPDAAGVPDVAVPPVPLDPVGVTAFIVKWFASGTVAICQLLPL